MYERDIFVVFNALFPKISEQAAGHLFNETAVVFLLDFSCLRTLRASA